MYKDEFYRRTWARATKKNVTGNERLIYNIEIMVGIIMNGGTIIPSNVDFNCRIYIVKGLLWAGQRE